MIASPAPLGVFKSTKTDGTPNANGVLKTYASGTNTPRATYTDSTLGTPNAVEVALDANGQANVWLGSLVYRFDLFDADGTRLPGYPKDGIQDSGNGVLVDLADATDAALGDALVAVKQPFTGAVAHTQHDRNKRTVNLLDFAAAGTLGVGSAAADTAALQAAISYAASSRNETVLVPEGTYYFNATITVPTGIAIVCPGSQGSTNSRGTVFYHQSNSDFLVWDGSGTDYMGTGGGLKNVLILKAAGYSGGSGVKVIATSDNKRPGEMIFDNVLVAANAGEGLWARGLEFNGSACNTPGARGVRHIHCRKVRAACCTTNNEYIVLNQVTHFFAHGLAIDQGTGTGTCGATLKGINDGVFIDGGDFAGALVITANDASNATTNLHFQGKIGGTFTNNDTAATGYCGLSELAGIANKSKNLRVITDKPIYFSAQMNAPVNDVTGDGTVYVVSFDTENSDYYGLFAANTFTCLAAGTYVFDWSVLVTGLLNTHTRVDAGLDQAGGTTKSHQHVFNPYAISASGLASINGSSVFDLAYGDTVQLKVAVANGTKVVDVYGNAGTQYTRLEGKYIA